MGGGLLALAALGWAWHLRRRRRADARSNIPPRLPRVFLTGVAVSAVALPTAFAFAIARMDDRLHTVSSSTGAWLLAEIQRAVVCGDFSASVQAGNSPSNLSNVLYPGLSALLARALALDPAWSAHLLSAALPGLIALALFLAWRSVGGWAVGVAGAAAVLFPPLIDTACLIRYDTLSIAILAGVGLACWRGATWPGGATFSWLAAGALAGLAYNTREFTLAPAVFMLATALVLGVRGRPVRAVAADAALVVLGLVLGWLVPCLLAGTPPTAGVAGLLSQSSRGNSYGGGWGRLEASFLPQLAWLLLPGWAGLVVTALRGRGRPAGRLMLAASLAWLFFPLSRQQSPQYYLGAFLLALSGWAGLIALVPWRVLRAVLAAVAVGGMLTWCQREMDPMRTNTGTLFSERWSVPPPTLDALVDEAHAAAGEAPLVVISSLVENLDGLVYLRTGRQPAHLFDNWLDRLPALRGLYAGRPLVMLVVDRPGPPDLDVPGTLLGRLDTPHYDARLLSLDPVPLPTPSEQAQIEREINSVRGATAQLAWLNGGAEGLCAWMATLPPPSLMMGFR